jgi:hypothetical protein
MVPYRDPAPLGREQVPSCELSESNFGWLESVPYASTGSFAILTWPSL